MGRVVEMDRSRRVLVTGAGGFIGGHLVAELRRRGFEQVRAVDLKPLGRWYQQHEGVENVSADLREKDSCYAAADDSTYVFNLAADMGGMGFIETHKADCMVSVLINTHLLLAARDRGVERFFFGSSACVYAAGKQTDPNVTALKEADAYPAMPEDGYGWEKLFSERMCRHFIEDYGISTRVPRFHNVYGPYGTYDGGREKAPAAICRKVIEAKLDGTERDRDLGRRRADAQLHVHRRLRRRHLPDHGERVHASRSISARASSSRSTGSSTSSKASPASSSSATTTSTRRKGVRGRNSDNTLIREQLGWEPSISLEDGLEKTYHWIHEQMTSGARDEAALAFQGT